MAGFLLQWPTFPTLAMFPILAAVYARLTIHEEHEVAAAFGTQWTRYAGQVNRFAPSRPRRDSAADPVCPVARPR
jgi:protein-S-isoprenylcysteine O-methyltransferase Ste14